MGEWKCNQEVIMCSIKVVQTSFCTKPKPSFNALRMVDGGQFKKLVISVYTRSNGLKSVDFDDYRMNGLTLPMLGLLSPKAQGCKDF